MSYCTSCGKALEPFANFCNLCGEKVLHVNKINSEASTAPAPAAAPTVTVTSNQAQPQVIIIPSEVNNLQAPGEIAKIISELISSIKSLLVLGFIGFFLYTTNPTTTSFLNFAKEKIQESGGSVKNTIVASFWITLAKEVTSREDYYFWSVFTVDTSLLSNGDSSVPVRIKFLGIGNRFFPTSEADLRSVVSKISE